MAEHDVTAGSTASVKGRGFGRVLSAEALAEAEAAFPFVDINSPTGKWIAEQLEDGVKRIDILTALARGRVPGTQE